MKLLSLGVCALLLGATLSPALAEDKMDHAMADHAVSGPLLTCVPAANADKAMIVAKMDEHDVPLQCKPAGAMADSKMVGKVALKTRAYGPNVDNLLTPGEIDAAWTKWTAMLLHLDRMVP